MVFRKNLRRMVTLLGVAAIVLGAVPAKAQGAEAQKSTGEVDAQTPLFPDDNKSLFPEPLFGGSLFSNDSMDKALDSATNPPQQSAQPTKAQSSAQAMEKRIALSQIDGEMRSQMRAVARYLQVYLVRNRNEFPALQNDEQYAAQVQLSELVPNNPYAFGSAEVTTSGIPAQYNPNGSPQIGSPVWGDNWTSHIQAEQNGRVQLQMNTSMTPQMIDDWAHHPPEEWTAAPGTITAIGNDQGLFVVWGAGADGKPVKNPMNGLTFVIAGTTSGTVNDQSAPNAY